MNNNKEIPMSLSTIDDLAREGKLLLHYEDEMKLFYVTQSGMNDWLISSSILQEIGMWILGWTIKGRLDIEPIQQENK